MPEDGVLLNHIENILSDADLSEMSLKAVRARVEQRLGWAVGSLDVHRAKMKILISKVVERI